MATIDYTAYRAERVIAKVQVPKLQGGTPISNVQQGPYTSGNGNSQITVVDGIDGQTATTENFVADAYKLRIKAPIDSNGSVPDVLISFSIGKVKQESLQITGTYWLNMFPSPDRLEGGYDAEILLGYPIYDALLVAHDYHAGRIGADRLVPNLPLAATGLKIGPNTILYIEVISQAGWGQSGTAIQPLTAELKGHVLKADVLSTFAHDYADQGQFRVLRDPFPGLAGTHALAGPLSTETWSQLPGGANQVGPVQIVRALVDAVNLNAIESSVPRYVYSNLTSVGGSPNQVTLLSNPGVRNQADLGDPANPNDAFVWNEIGFAFDPSQVASGANPQMYVGFRINNSETVPGNNNGRLVSLRENPFQWGAKYPQGAASNVFLPMPPASRFGGILSWGAGVAPQISTLGLATLPAQSVHVLKGGRRVTGQLQTF